MYNVYAHRKGQKTRSRLLVPHKPSPTPKKHRLDEPRKAAEGCIPLLHPDLHEFRPIQGSSSLYLRHYLPDTQRVQKAQELFRSSCLAEPYNPFSPHNRVDWLRASAQEDTANRSFHSPEKRLAREIAHRRYITADKPTLGAAILHSFRDRNRSMDAAQEEFTHYSRDFRDPVWRTLDLYSKDPYLDGLEALGDVRKKREKAKELSASAFTAGGQRQVPSVSQSWRSYKAQTTTTQCDHLGCGGKMSSIYSWNVPITVPPVHDTTPCMDYMLAYEECIFDAVPTHVQVYHPNWPTMWPRLLTDGNLRPDVWEDAAYIKGPLGPGLYQWTEENYKKSLGRRLLINPHNRYSSNIVPNSNPDGDMVMRELWKEFVSEGNSP